MDARHFDALKKLCGGLDAASLARLNLQARTQLAQYPEGRKVLRYGGGDNTIAYTAALIFLLFLLYTFIGKGSRGDDGDVRDDDVDDDDAGRDGHPRALGISVRKTPADLEPAPVNYIRCDAEVPDEVPGTREPFIQTFDIKPGTLLIIDPAGLAFEKGYLSFGGCGGVSASLYRIFSLYLKNKLDPMSPGEVTPHPRIWSPTSYYYVADFYASVPAIDNRIVIRLLHAMCPDGRSDQFKQAAAFYANLEEVMNNISDVIGKLLVLSSIQPLQVWIPNLSGGAFLGDHPRPEYMRVFTKLVYELCKKHPSVVFKHNVYVKPAPQVKN